MLLFKFIFIGVLGTISLLIENELPVKSKQNIQQDTLLQQAINDLEPILFKRESLNVTINKKQFILDSLRQYKSTTPNNLYEEKSMLIDKIDAYILNKILADYKSFKNLDKQLLNKKITSFSNDIFKLNGTSEYYTAFSGGIGYREKNYGVKINYKRIEPDFKTMGAYFFNSDLENWTINPNANLFKGKFKFNGSIGIQRDNLKNQKRAENNRIIASANAGLEITKALGLDLIYTNFSDNQTPQTALFADSLRIVQTSQTIGFMPRYFIVKPEATHVISASASFSSLKDFNNFFSAQAESRDINTNQYFINYNITLPKKQLSLFANLNSTKLTGQDLENSFIGATLGGNKSFFKQKMQTSLSCTLTKTNTNTGSDSFITNANGNLAYNVSKSQRISFNLFLTNNKSKAVNLLQPNFTETRAELSYQFNF